mmetsp:Transcript_20056/g.64657  ORF Transcript_20056/g.64657 Transcript_20056/m.64657 type:complete len:521 (-) Transcript_20056:136-1698(-)
MLQSFAPRGVSTPVPDDAKSYRMAACQPEIADAKETKIESRALTVVPVDVGRGVLTLDVEQTLAQRTPPTAPAREGARACHRSEHPGGGGGEYPYTHLWPPERGGRLRGGGVGGGLVLRCCCHGRGVEVAPRGERAVLCEEAVVVVAQRLQRAHRPLLAAARRQLAAAHLAHLRSRPHGRARRRLVRRAGSPNDDSGGAIQADVQLKEDGGPGRHAPRLASPASVGEGKVGQAERVEGAVQHLAMVEVKVEQRRRGVGRGGGGALEGGEEAIWPSARGDGEDGVDEDAPREPHRHLVDGAVQRRRGERRGGEGGCAEQPRLEGPHQPVGDRLDRLHAWPAAGATRAHQRGEVAPELLVPLRGECLLGLLRAAVKRALARAVPAVEEHVGPRLGEGDVDRRALCFREASAGAPLEIAAGKGGGRLDAEAGSLRDEGEALRVVVLWEQARVAGVAGSSPLSHRMALRHAAGREAARFGGERPEGVEQRAVRRAERDDARVGHLCAVPHEHGHAPELGGCTHD